MAEQIYTSFGRKSVKEFNCLFTVVVILHCNFKKSSSKKMGQLKKSNLTRNTFGCQWVAIEKHGENKIWDMQRKAPSSSFPLF